MSSAVRRKRGRPRRDEPPEINDFDLALIQEFQSRPAFYDRAHPHYRNREHLEPHWQEMSNNLGFPVALVKERMLQLRNRYSMEKRRLEMLKEQDSTSTSALKSQWSLFEKLSFLGDFIKQRRSFARADLSSAILPKNATRSNSGSSDADDYDNSLQHVNGGTVDNDSAPSSNSKTNTKSNMKGQEKASDPPDLSDANQIVSVSEHIGEADANGGGAGKYKAFGEFLTSSLVEMDEADALHLIQTFTVELVKVMQSEYNAKCQRQRMEYENNDRDAAA